MRGFAAFLSVLVLAGPVAGQETAVTPEPGCVAAGAEQAVLSEVVDGGTLRLANGEIVLLAGIDVPRGLAGEGQGAVAAARSELERLAGGPGAPIRFRADGRDRHGRLVAQVFHGTGRLLQAELVASGFARVRPYPHAIPCLDRLLQLEDETRHVKRALWNNDFAVLAANDLSLVGRKGLYVLVEGFVLSVGRGNRVDFLNFGRFWQRDFTVLVSAPVAARLAETGLVTAALAERRVRIRGVIEERGGPAIWLNDFRELEILDDD